MSESLAKLQEALRAKRETAPPDFKSAREWAGEWGVSGSCARLLLRDALHANPPMVEKAMYFTRDRSDKRVPHYKMLI